MGSRDLNGLYLKDYQWREIPGTWTGFVSVAGKDWLIVAFEVRLDADEVVCAASNDKRSIAFMEQLYEMFDYGAREFEVIEANDGQKFVLFMPPG